MLQVTNNNTFDLVDRYDGQDFTFPAGATVALGEDAARHIFGFGEADKIPYLARQGWVRNSGEIEAGMQKLNGFSFASYETPLPGKSLFPTMTIRLLSRKQSQSARSRFSTSWAQMRRQYFGMA